MSQAQLKLVRGELAQRRKQALLGDLVPPGVEGNAYFPKGHPPSPKQQAFLWYTGLEAMYGGAAGGGKSDALLMAALQYVKVPHYSALILRRTFRMLNQAGGLIPRSKQWLMNTSASWNENDKKWTFPSGATIEFGHLQHPDDIYNYQGAEFQFIGFDELTEFTRYQYIFLFSRLRRLEGYPVPIRMRSATNPGGYGHEWVKKRFIEREDSPPDDETERIFIPARLSDNEAIDQAAYIMALSQLDEQTRAQLLDGDWNARMPGNWVIPDHRWIDAAVDFAYELTEGGALPPEPSGGFISAGIDWGEITQGYVMWPLERGGLYIPPSEVVTRHQEPSAASLAVLAQLATYGHPVSDVRYDAAGAQSMRTFVATARKQPGWEKLRTTAIPFNKYKREAINYLRFLMKRTYEGYDTRVIGIHPSNTELLRQLRVWELKVSPEGEVKDETTKHDDHGPDALVAGIAPIAHRHRAAFENEIAQLYSDEEPQLIDMEAA